MPKYKKISEIKIRKIGNGFVLTIYGVLEKDNYESIKEYAFSTLLEATSAVGSLYEGE